MDIVNIQSLIYEIEGKKVMLDHDLASLYEVETRVLNQAVKRNFKRFPPDFMFRLNEAQYERIKLLSNSSQIVMSSKNRGKSYLPYAFTEQGLAMLSGILNSEKAIEVNIAIMRTFVSLRRFAQNYEELAVKIAELDIKYDDISDALSYLLQKDQQLGEQQSRAAIGFK